MEAAKGKAIHQWGKMMNDDLAAIAGKYEELVGRLQEKYGIANEESRHRSDDFKKVIGKLKESNARLMALQAGLKNAKSAPRNTASKTAVSKTSRSRVRR